MAVLPLLSRVVLTVLLVVAGGLCLSRCRSRTAGSTPTGRLNDATHVLMSAEMIAMAWSWSVPDPFGVQVVVFAVAAGWFAVQATGVPITRAALRPAVAGGSCGPRSHTPVGTPCIERSGHRAPSRTQCVHHGALMVAMVWMLGAGAHLASTSLPTASMTGMAMPAASTAGMAIPLTGGVSLSDIGRIAGAYCLVVAAGWAVVVIRRRRHHPGAAVVRYLAADPLMTAAMGLMLVMMG
jgi:hypothetical protein